MNPSQDLCNRAYYEQNRESAENGLLTKLFDPRDAVAWYILQAETFATDRLFWTPEEAARTVPYIKRIGQLYDRLARVDGVEERVERFVNGDATQPDGPIYELLVAGAWADRGYTVRFVSEQRGIARTPDLEVTKGRSRWAVEAKRMMPSAYQKREIEAGRRIAESLHDLSESLGHSVVVDVVYHRELTYYSKDFLAECVRGLLPVHEVRIVDHKDAHIAVRQVAWPLCRQVLADDYVYIGSTRMMELVNAGHDHDWSHSLRARCRRLPERPSFADHIYHASSVNWVCASPVARDARAKHFKKKLIDAEGQLPDDLPGVIHVGMESSGRPESDLHRHFNNGSEAAGLAEGRSRLRWVYGNYFKVEVTTRPNESLAMEETAARYKVGRHRTGEPLASRLLLSDDEARPQLGAYWD
ncbi:hypothetical protein SAMN04244548_05327 [Paracoccus pantotrophus]|nr:hypothetical protein SAMN04244548_05327 [Paracoccus pantotrophus]